MEKNEVIDVSSLYLLNKEQVLYDMWDSCL